MGTEAVKRIANPGPEAPALIPKLLWQACDGMMVIDEARRIIAMNPTLQQWVGAAVSEADCGALLGGRNLHGDCLASRPQACPGLRAMRTGLPVNAAEYSVRTAQGQRRIVSASYTPMQDPSTHVLYTLVIMRDITRSKHREQRLAERAMLDPLTGLYNRTALFDAAVRELKNAERMQRPCAVALIDVDGLKTYNDAYGHAAGDELLAALARVFRIGHRTSEFGARYGGDEFVMLLPETEAVGALACAERIRQAVEQFPFRHAHVTVSIGIAVFPSDGLTPHALLAIADQRLYRGKHAGKNRVIGPTPIVELRKSPRVALQAPMIIRRQSDEVGVASHEASVANLSMGGAFATVSDWQQLEKEDMVFFAIRIPKESQAQFPLSHLIGSGQVQRIMLLDGREAPGQLGVSIKFGDELVMVAAATA